MNKTEIKARAKEQKELLDQRVVYLHRRTTDDSIFYVGKGDKYRPNKKSGRNKHWHNIVNKNGFYSQVVMTDLTDSEAIELECFLISEIGRENLCNYTDGGEGVMGLHEEGRKAISERMKGNKHGVGNKGGNGGAKKPVSVHGIEYISLNECHRQTGIAKGTLHLRLNNPEKIEYHYVKNTRESKSKVRRVIGPEGKV